MTMNEKKLFRTLRMNVMAIKREKIRGFSPKDPAFFPGLQMHMEWSLAQVCGQVAGPKVEMLRM